MDAESDDTAAVPEPTPTERAARSDETDVVARTKSEPELAWSVDGPDYTHQWLPGDLPPNESSGRPVWLVYTAIAAAVVAFVGVVAFWWGRHERTEVAAPTNAPLATATSLPAATVPPEAAAPQTPNAAPTSARLDPYAYALPGCYWQSDPPTERPTAVTFQFCADGGERLESMSWSSWGAAGAQGTGILSYRVCEPNCADGHQEQYAINVSAFAPRPADFDSRCPRDTMFYSEMVVSFPASAPNSTAMAADTTYLGKPAIRFTTASGAPARDFLGRQLCG